MSFGWNFQSWPNLAVRAAIAWRSVVNGHLEVPEMRSQTSDDFEIYESSLCKYAVLAFWEASSPGYLTDLSIGWAQYSRDRCDGVMVCGPCCCWTARELVSMLICCCICSNCCCSWDSRCSVADGVAGTGVVMRIPVDAVRFGTGTRIARVGVSGVGVVADKSCMVSDCHCKKW